MTNETWLKNQWIAKIYYLTTEEIYDLLTNGTISGGICKYCEPVFGSCDDTLKNDDICKNRFNIWCNMVYQQKE